MEDAHVQQRYYVRLWLAIGDSAPTVQTYVQAISEGHAIVQLMKTRRLSYVSRASVAWNVLDEPMVRVVDVVVSGKTRRWRQEPDFWTKRPPVSPSV
jgi:hypothetical protein